MDKDKIDYVICKCGNTSWYIHHNRILCDNGNCNRSYGLGYLRGEGITKLDVEDINKRMSESEDE